MLPMRQVSLRLAARHVSHTPCGKCNAFFSTTAALGPRIRPGSGLPSRPASNGEDHQAAETPKPAARDVPRWDDPESSEGPAANRQPDYGSEWSIEAERTLDPMWGWAKQPEKQRKKRNFANRGAKPHEQAIYNRESICYRREGDQPVGEDDQARLSGAADFFEAGCRFLYSASSIKNHRYNDLVPEIVVLGASNAGKSSFLNALGGVVNAARVSPRPGKTDTMNAYGLGPRSVVPRQLLREGTFRPLHSLVIMDTPGYGFKSRADWGSGTLTYLKTRKMLRGAVLLLPIYKGLLESDRWILETLASARIRTLVVLTKTDRAGDEWPVACRSLATLVQSEMAALGTSPTSDSSEGTDRAFEVYATAAGMNNSSKIGNGAGLGGVRLAILEMAGFAPGSKVKEQARTKSYSGEVVPFHQIKWK